MPHLYLIDCPSPRRASLLANYLSSQTDALCLTVDAPVLAAAYLLMDEIEDPSHLIVDDTLVPDYQFTVRQFCDEYRALLERMAPGGRLRALISEIESNAQWFDSFIIEDGAPFASDLITRFGTPNVSRIFFHEDRDPTAADATRLLSDLETP